MTPSQHKFLTPPKPAVDTLSAADLAAVFSRAILVGVDLVEDLVHLPDESRRNPAADYGALTRAMRQNALMLEHLAKPAADPTPHRVAACERVIRDVEDAIELQAEGRDPAALRAELLERLAAPDTLEKLDTTTAEQLTTDLRRDLHLARPYNHAYRRRSVADAAALHAAALVLAGPVAPPLLGRAPAPVPAIRPEADNHDLR